MIWLLSLVIKKSEARHGSKKIRVRRAHTRETTFEKTHNKFQSPRILAACRLSAREKERENVGVSHLSRRRLPFASGAMEPIFLDGVGVYVFQNLGRCF